MRRLTAEHAKNLVAEYVENRTLDDLLEELKMYGTVTISNSGKDWHCQYQPKVKRREYQFDNSGSDLLQLVKNCLSLVYFSQAQN